MNRALRSMASSDREKGNESPFMRGRTVVQQNTIETKKGSLIYVKSFLGCPSINSDKRGVALRLLPVTQPSWVGASFALLALLLLFLSFRASTTGPGGRGALSSVPQENKRTTLP
jgi:hypothetical protein